MKRSAPSLAAPVLFAAAVLCAGLALTVAQSSDESTPPPSDWPNWLGPNADGTVAEAGFETDWSGKGPRTAWQARVGVGYSAVTVADGRAYTLGNDNGRDTVYCFDAASGEEIWTRSYPCPPGRQYPGPRSTPAVHDGRVYTLSREGDLVCLSADEGKPIWHENLKKKYGARGGNWGLAGSPMIYDDKLVVDVGVVLCLDPVSGEPHWTSSDKAKAGYSSPAMFELDGRTYLATFNAEGLWVLDFKSGRVLDRMKWETSYDVNAVTPLVREGKIFISSGYNVGCALASFDGRKLSGIYRNKNMRNQFSTCVLRDGHLYGIDGQAGGRGKLTCMTWRDGEVKWRQRGLGTGALMLAGDKLVVQGERGDLVVAAASPDGYEEIARQSNVLNGTCWTMPVLAGGRIYCRNDRGHVVCLDVREP